jgi:hypothetical protein
MACRANTTSAVYLVAEGDDICNKRDYGDSKRNLRYRRRRKQGVELHRRGFLKLALLNNHKISSLVNEPPLLRTKDAEDANIVRF